MFHGVTNKADFVAPPSQVWLNWFKDIFTTYPTSRKFLLHFMTDFSHDDNNLMTQVSRTPLI